MKSLKFLVKQMDIFVFVCVIWFGNVFTLKLAATLLVVGLIIYIKLSTEQIAKVVIMMKKIVEGMKNE